MPQLEQIHTYPSQVFWLIVCFAALFFFLRYVALPRMTALLDARRRRIESDLEQAAALKTDAEKILAQYQAAVAEGRDKAQAVLRRTADEAQARAAAALESVAQKLQQQIKAGEERIDQARRAALGNVERVSAELAQAAVVRLVGLEVDAAAAAGAVGAAARERQR